MIYRLIKRLAPKAYSLFARIAGFPLFIQVETSTTCNLRCAMCEFSYLKNKGKNMTFEQFSGIFSQIQNSLPFFVKLFPQLLLFDLTGMGEALLNKDFLKIVKFVKSKGATLTFADNFTILDEKIARYLIEQKVDLIFISFDGATKRTFESMRRGAKFSVVLHNIKNFVKLRSKRKKPELVIRFLASNKNVSELPLLVRLAYKLGVKKISVTIMRTFEKTASLKLDKENLGKFKKQAVAEAERLGIELDFGLFGKEPITKCHRPFDSMFITQAGFVLPCCFVTQTGKYEEIIKKYNLGNVFSQNLKEIWNSKKYKEFRKKISRGKAPELCKDCYLFYPLRH